MGLTERRHLRRPARKRGAVAVAECNERATSSVDCRQRLGAECTIQWVQLYATHYKAAELAGIIQNRNLQI